MIQALTKRKSSFFIIVFHLTLNNDAVVYEEHVLLSTAGGTVETLSTSFKRANRSKLNIEPTASLSLIKASIKHGLAEHIRNCISKPDVSFHETHLLFSIP